MTMTTRQVLAVTAIHTEGVTRTAENANRLMTEILIHIKPRIL